ncbi:MAG: trehalose-6-phosphate synthase [Ilumatobacteraceae bacterium]
MANRLPVQRTAAGWALAPGGLVTALRPVMESRDGVWVGWDGGSRNAPRSLPSMQIGLRPVKLSATAVSEYYHGFSNRTLWPLLHNAIERPVFDRQWWATYRDVNARFADAAVAALDDVDDALLWVHDYQLLLTPDLVRRARPDQPIGFFLHVPFPAPDIFARLPWRVDVLLGMLGADVVSFHTEPYRKNFVRSCGRLLREVTVRGTDLVMPDGRRVRTTASPISVDAATIRTSARSATVDAEVAALAEQFEGRTVLLGVDRLDYTKGIIERLLAFELLLEQRPELVGDVALVQIAVPSRDDVQEYRDLRDTVERMVGRINGRFTQPGDDVPVHYLYRSLPPERLYAYYAFADVMLVTPLIDGMNLVAKEYVVVQGARKGAGALVLSEFTGAALELREAVPCNPFDVHGLATQLEVALALDPESRRRANRSMANRVHRNDVHAWLDGQLGAIAPEH